ncbi:MAG: FkbM family methyltransferase [Deltaproteobacteria bacterium]|nr:FkbM family methyltransferase [Deltaproteobacteria bacterium]
MNATTLCPCREKHYLKHIDLLSLDVEGSEAPVLKGIAFDRRRI